MDGAVHRRASPYLPDSIADDDRQRDPQWPAGGSKLRERTHLDSTHPRASAIDQAVAHTPDVDDVAPRLRVELAPQAAGVRIERPGAAHRPKAPDVTEQLLLREHPGWLPGERAQQRELLVGQAHQPLTHPPLAARGVDEDVTHPPRALAPRIAPAQHGANPGGDLGIVERFDDVVVRALREAADAIGLGGAGAEHDHRKGGVIAAGGAF